MRWWGRKDREEDLERELSSDLELATSPKVAVINETMARRFFPWRIAYRAPVRIVAGTKWGI
jgi:hypothetical protein